MTGIRRLVASGLLLVGMALFAAPLHAAVATDLTKHGVHSRGAPAARCLQTETLALAAPGLR